VPSPKNHSWLLAWVELLVKEMVQGTGWSNPLTLNLAFVTAGVFSLLQLSKSRRDARKMTFFIAGVRIRK
jgi:hypothetical protein